MSALRYFLFTLLIIAIDQTVKLAVHEYMLFGEAGEIKVFGDWFKLYYTLNPGMAFGLELGFDYGKLFLTLFRIIAMGVMVWFIYTSANKVHHSGFLYCMAAILGGATGNVIDSTFYGVLLNNAPHYAPNPWFHGQVIDMFYFDIWKGYLPEWIPGIGGEFYALWPIFNIADASIFCGIATIMVLQNKFFAPTEVKPTTLGNNTTPTTSSSENQSQEVNA